MDTITSKDGTPIYYKDWGRGPVVTFSHGWPLNADAWDGQMLFLVQHGPALLLGRCPELIQNRPRRGVAFGRREGLRRRVRLPLAEGGDHPVELHGGEFLERLFDEHLPVSFLLAW